MFDFFGSILSESGLTGSDGSIRCRACGDRFSPEDVREKEQRICGSCSDKGLYFDERASKVLDANDDDGSGSDIWDNLDWDSMPD